jgi:hypothetical protein
MSASSTIYSPADPMSDEVFENSPASSLEYVNLREFEERLEDPADSRARGPSGL